MLFTSLLVAVSAFSGFVSAQSSNESSLLPAGQGECCKIDPNSVSSKTRDEWCKAQRNTCPELCGGVNQLAAGGQDCNRDTLEYTCECKNGTVPKMEDYQQSVPALMCRAWFDQCIQKTNQDLEQQVECTNQRDTKCGNLTTGGAADTTTTTSKSSSASATSTSTQKKNEESTAATAAESSTVPTGAATALAMANAFGLPVLAGGIAALFGLAL